ncbi:hypothetical protein PV726_11350 [Streptomyces europaeiscabiei]|uniref:hypothetical protein n=1 Tax=Streptomyces europaeiscabiei TaxID=146819 RepID=UPI0029BD490A|nr:hypothetical protein [Streptomyces europaeiscabiei]MDX3690910.1 hypothetical protein [Streptomyces europaeiscabiei]
MRMTVANAPDAIASQASQGRSGALRDPHGRHRTASVSEPTLPSSISPQPARSFSVAHFVWDPNLPSMSEKS